MSTPEQNNGDLHWLLNNFAERIPGAMSTVVVTTDGLVLALSERVERDTADQLAAITSGLVSLTAGAARFLAGGAVKQAIVEMEQGYLFVTNISDGSALAVMCDSTCDIGLIGYEMSLLVARIGRALTPELRSALSATMEV